MFTRKDYMSGECTHREYYAQFATDEQKLAVMGVFADKIASGLSVSEWGDLNQWDKVCVYSIASNLLIDAGDYYTLAGAVCINKEAARQIMGE